MRALSISCLVTALLCLGSTNASACDARGKVFCDVNQNGTLEMADDSALEGVTVRLENLHDGTYLETTTDAAGNFYINLPETYAMYRETLVSGLPADAIYIIPPGGTNDFVIGDVTWTNYQDWLIDSASCRPVGCWLTGGGVKFSNITDSRLGELTIGDGHGPVHNFGGNVFPSCDPAPGDGGQWNHIAHDLKLHFQGTSIHTVACGNLDPAITDPGSESPVTPFNYIEFAGTGTLKGIKGNKDDFGTVYFVARAEDRNEPGNENAAKDDGGATIDHYYLRVYDGDGNTLLLVEDPNLPGDMDPIRITGGNLQLHISSCDNIP